MTTPYDPCELLALATGHMAARAIHAATLLGFFDSLSTQPTTADELARVTCCEAGSALRLLRALATLGLAAESSGGGFCATSAAMPLRRDAQTSLRNLVLMFGSERSWRSWGHLADNVRSGQTAALDIYGMNGFDYFAANPGPAATFHAAMAEVAQATASALMEAHDFSQHRSIADIGGGNGALIARALGAAPNAKGVLFDLAGALPGASARLYAAGVDHRCEVVEGDFFASIPGGSDLYLLKNVLHDWDDASCVRILRQLRIAMGASSAAILIERVLEDRAAATREQRSMALMDLQHDGDVRRSRTNPASIR